ncbi:GntR family transcriptional regulator [Mangrovibrevibacter kandeliae]|uniref:GntR family transcriptional regulator n=1 Tax=Mangrovibrevibacter kandeliae TaxID=2968473 RepID=UPI002118C19C|nr:GntR family transcriptional regulator [Aurantimonas sp. CSK15Z-1]MCQ8781546.1 GntR family transcriptional regulator [Aurantimonas sp. CSK15Z-1]
MRADETEAARPTAAAALERRFNLDRRRPAALQVYEDLRDRILTLDLQPGESLSRPALAAYYTVSQMPVRDAFLKLEAEGLVDVFPQSKTLVARIDVRQARETQFLRTALELEIVSAIAGRGGRDAVVSRARRLLEGQERARDEADLALFAELDRQFHATLYEALDQGALWDLVQARSGHIDRLRKLDLPTPGKIARVLDEHGAILAALEAGDGGAATAAVRTHLSGTLATVDRIAAAHPHYF